MHKPKLQISTPLLMTIGLIGLSACNLPGSIQPKQLKSFESDGCSLFPDGTPKEPKKWCDCCYAHDISYWKGGTRQQRLTADQELRQCVQSINKSLSKSMYGGVRTFGGPYFPTTYRWGFGWPYFRGYKPRSKQEDMEIQRKWNEYLQGGKVPFCKL
ncbi:FAD-binding oxidoreductase [Pseudomonadota bacterium]